MNNTVTFKVAGNDVISFIDKIKAKNTEMTNQMISEAQKQSSSSRDQLKMIEDQIKAIERRNRLESAASRENLQNQRDLMKSKNSEDYSARVEEINNNTNLSKFQRVRQIGDASAAKDIKDEEVDKTYKEQISVQREQERQQVTQTKLLRDNIETIKTTANTQLSQLRKNNGELVDELDKNSTPIEDLSKRLAEDRYEEEKGKRGKDGKGDNVFGSLLSVDSLNKFLNTVQTFTSTQNGFDLIKPASQGIGQILGGVIGGIIGTFIEPGGGTMIGAGLGSSIGSTIGGGVGEFEQRRAMAAQDFLRNKYSYEATTGTSVSGIPDTAGMGVSAADFLASMKQMAVASGSMQRAAENTKVGIALQKGVGVSQETTTQFLHLFRGTQKDVSNLVAGVMNKGRNGVFAGGDNTFLNEFLGRMASLQNQMQQNTESVATGATYDILTKFDKLGGAFSVRDSRSAGLVGQINNALVNPTSDNANVLSMLALRKNNPNMGMADLMMEREKGLSSPAYFKALLSQVDQMGGDDQFKRMNIAGLFGVNQSAAKRIFDGRDQLMKGDISQKGLEDLYKGDFQGVAEGKTTAIEKNTADISNGLLSSWYTTMDAMQSSFQIAMESAFNGATIEMKNGSISFSSGPISNVLKTKKSTLPTTKSPAFKFFGNQISDASGAQ